MTEQAQEKKQRWKPESEDVIAVIGLALLTAGIYWIYPPAALIVLGGFFLFYSYLAATPKGASGNR